MTTRTPAFWGYPLPPHDYPYYWVILDPKSKEDKVKGINLKNLPKFQIFEFWNKLYTRHTFWSCLIRCANMKWIQLYCWRYRVDTDGQGETSISHFQLCWSRGYNEIFASINLTSINSFLGHNADQSGVVGNLFCRLHSLVHKLINREHFAYQSCKKMVGLTHWPLGDFTEILDKFFSS